MKWLNILLGIVIGIIFSYFFNIFLISNQFKFNYEFNIANILNIFITLLVAVIFGVLYNKINSEKRFEKDFLIKKINEVLLPLNKIQSLLNQYVDIPYNPNNILTIASNLRQVGIRLSQLTKMTNISKFHLDVEEIHRKNFNIKKILTDQTEGIPYNSKDIYEFNKIKDSIEICLYQLIININKS